MAPAREPDATATDPALDGFPFASSMGWKLTPCAWHVPSYPMSIRSSSAMVREPIYSTGDMRFYALTFEESLSSCQDRLVIRLEPDRTLHARSQSDVRLVVARAVHIGGSAILVIIMGTFRDDGGLDR